MTGMKGKILGLQQLNFTHRSRSANPAVGESCYNHVASYTIGTTTSYCYDEIPQTIDLGRLRKLSVSLA